jgi:hypothetical protein
MSICADSSYLKIMVSEKNLTPKEQVARDKYMEMADILTDMLIILVLCYYTYQMRVVHIKLTSDEHET